MYMYAFTIDTRGLNLKPNALHEAITTVVRNSWCYNLVNQQQLVSSFVFPFQKQIANLIEEELFTKKLLQKMTYITNF